MMLFIVILGILSQSLAQNNDNSQTANINFKVASESFVKLIQTADKEVADIMIKMTQKSAELYKELLPLLAHLSLNGKTVTVNNVDVTFNKDITMAEFQIIFDKLMQLLKGLENSQPTGTSDFIDVAKNVQEAFSRAIANPSAYSDDSWLNIKSKLLDAFKDANAIVRNSVIQLLNIYHNRLEELADQLERVLQLLPINEEKWAIVRSKVRGLINKLKDKVTPAAISNIESAEKTAEADFILAIEEISKDQSISKRSISDIWSKVKSAVGKLGDSIKDATMKVIEENKPKVLEQLQTLKMVVVDAAKNIVIRINGAIIEVIVGNLSAIS
ncbi:uncharacterized protein LOC100208683 isoform X1 [Hydra vulgaris]|uniref:uncharacterized protein LOC100208683 isoform X1 n=1 Tax=Hydra vulgaris TaxID=6087 RepID=UPI00019269E6|nr:uncharacterized protein LOC100208683 [Hydra vulgaris]